MLRQKTCGLVIGAFNLSLLSCGALSNRSQPAGTAPIDLSAADLHQLYQTVFIENAGSREAALEAMRGLPIETYYKALVSKQAQTPVTLVNQGPAAGKEPSYAQTSAVVFHDLAAAYGTFGAYWDNIGFQPSSKVSEAQFTSYVAGAFAASRAMPAVTLALTDASANFDPLSFPYPDDGEACSYKVTPARVYPDANTAPAGSIVIYDTKQGGRIGLMPEILTKQAQYIDQLELLLAGAVQTKHNGLHIFKYDQAPCNFTTYFVQGAGNCNSGTVSHFPDGNVHITRNDHGAIISCGQQGPFF